MSSLNVVIESILGQQARATVALANLLSARVMRTLRTSRSRLRASDARNATAAGIVPYYSEYDHGSSHPDIACALGGRNDGSRLGGHGQIHR